MNKVKIIWSYSQSITSINDTNFFKNMYKNGEFFFSFVSMTFILLKVIFFSLKWQRKKTHVFFVKHTWIFGLGSILFVKYCNVMNEMESFLKLKNISVKLMESFYQCDLSTKINGVDTMLLRWKCRFEWDNFLNEINIFI